MLLCSSNSNNDTRNNNCNNSNNSSPYTHKSNRIIECSNGVMLVAIVKSSHNSNNEHTARSILLVLLGLRCKNSLLNARVQLPKVFRLLRGDIEACWGIMENL